MHDANDRYDLDDATGTTVPLNFYSRYRVHCLVSRHFRFSHADNWWVDSVEVGDSA